MFVFKRDGEQIQLLQRVTPSTAVGILETCVMALVIKLGPSFHSKIDTEHENLHHIFEQVTDIQYGYLYNSQTTKNVKKFTIGLAKMPLVPLSTSIQEQKYKSRLSTQASLMDELKHVLEKKHNRRTKTVEQECLEEEESEESHLMIVPPNTPMTEKRIIRGGYPRVASRFDPK